MRYKVIQSRNGNEGEQVGPTTRRFNGAVHVMDAQVEDCAQNLRGKALRGERVVVGPTTQGEHGPQRVYLVARDFTFFVEYRIERA